ncbi:hypothetical protein [Streptomyces sp. NPDC087856]|uniref:hypothetical protein n=1 Tax=Streptomyces sp. NPDC087856 TaxID=3365811 RepID=UPI003815BA70
MSWTQNRAKKQATRRHRDLLSVAQRVVSRATLDRSTGQIAEVVALAFGRHELRITDDEALDYLNAVLAERGFPLHAAALPAPRDEQDGEDQ